MERLPLLTILHTHVDLKNSAAYLLDNQPPQYSSQVITR